MGFIKRNQNAFLIMVYIVNIIATAVIGLITLYSPISASRYVFNEAYKANDSMRVSGSFWIGVGITSLIGLFRPMRFCPIMVVILIYKVIFLVVEVIPKMMRNEAIPIGLTVCFVVYVVFLPFIIPWKHLLSE